MDKTIIRGILFGIFMAAAWAVFALLHFSRGNDMFGIAFAGLSIANILKAIFTYRKAKSK